MALYLVPASRANLEQSIERSVSPDMVRKHVDQAMVGELLSRSGTDGLRCWAMSTGMKSTFDKMRSGDDVLFSESATGKFTHYGQVIGKVVSHGLGAALWPLVYENPWDYIYFLRNVMLSWPNIPIRQAAREYGSLSSARHR